MCTIDYDALLLESLRQPLLKSVQCLGRACGACCPRKPSPFLGEDSKCTIYDVRPEKCQGYSFTDKPDFAFSTVTHAKKAVVCPPVFYLVRAVEEANGAVYRARSPPALSRSR